MAFGQNGALRVVEPVPAKDGTIMTGEPALSLRGTLAWTGGDTRVLWTNQRGFSDLATVTVSDDRQTVHWHTTAPIPLRPGVNHVRIRALGQPGAATFVNIYYSVSQPATPPPQRTARLKGQQITYELIDGRAVYQSDMILGDEVEVARGRFAGRFGARGLGLRPEAATITPNLQYASGLWPVVNGVVRVPYTIAGTSGDVANINAAITESNTQLARVVQWVPATGSDVNLVNFDLEGASHGGCEAIVGMQGNGSQPINGASNCTLGTILHEMGHALGLYHEQSRSDRNHYVVYHPENVDRPQASNFDTLQNEAVSGLYNYASIMEYSPFSFSLYGIAPVIETQPTGVVLSTDLPQYTTGDLDGIMRLYGFTPSAVTVDVNPSGLGLQLVVDGVTCTAPCVFSDWTIGSTHTLAVPTDAHGQTLQIPSSPNPPQPYIFGNWNTSPGAQSPVPTQGQSPSTSQSIMIVNSPGDGTLLSPTTSPAVTNYLASFIPVHPYSPVVQPAGKGTITPTPAPSTLFINNTSTSYYAERQQVTLNVQPSNGYSFYEWANVALDSLYTNPYTFYIFSNFDYLQFNPSSPVTAVLVTDPVLSLGAETPDNSSGAFSPGFAVGLVGSQIPIRTPRNFAQSIDGIGFKAGAALTFCASGYNGSTCPSTAPTQSPVTTNMTYSFSEWTGYKGGSTNALTLNMPSSNQEIAPYYTDSFRVIILPSPSAQYCAGVSVTTSPPPAVNNGTDGGLDAFFPYNQGLTNLIATGNSDVHFVGWSGDLGSAANPYQQTLSGELVATANFNVATTTAPLAVTSVSPATPTVTNGASTLIVTGTGFTTNGNTYAYLATGFNKDNKGETDFDPRNITVQSSTQLTMQLHAGDLASVGYAQILIVNTGPSGCNPETTFTFPVANSTGAPALSISKMHNGVFGPGQQGAQYTVLATNSGTGTISEPVTVTETVPSGETLVSMSGGSAWNCSTLLVPPACTTSNTLAPGHSYPAITVTVNVSPSATSPQINSVTVSGGGAQQATATDSTTIVSTVSVPNVTNEPQATAQSAITSAGLTVGQVTTATSNTVPAGDVISTNPTAGTAAAPGSAVDLVVSTGPAVTLQSISVTPANPSIVVGTAQQFRATGTYSDTNTADLTNSVTWSSGTTAVASIATGGNASGLKVGTSTISAKITSPAVTGSTLLTVTPLGPCDLNQDGLYTVVDAQAMINEALGNSQPGDDLNGDHVVNAVDLQIVINAALNRGCTI